MARKKKAAGVAGAEEEARYQVFISHATADKWLATVLCEKIEARGAATFRDDRDIAGGDDIPEEIRRQIQQSQEMVVLLTPESVNRPWVLVEVGAAWGQPERRRIVVVLCHVTTDPIPAMIKNEKAVPLNDFNQYLNELGRRVHEHEQQRAAGD